MIANIFCPKHLASMIKSNLCKYLWLIYTLHVVAMSFIPGFIFRNGRHVLWPGKLKLYLEVCETHAGIEPYTPVLSKSTFMLFIKPRQENSFNMPSCTVLQNTIQWVKLWTWFRYLFTFVQSLSPAMWTLYKVQHFEYRKVSKKEIMDMETCIIISYTLFYAIILHNTKFVIQMCTTVIQK